MNADRKMSAFASLRFTGDDLDPEMVSAAVGLEPTLAYRKGQSYRAGRGDREVVGRTGLWLLRTEPTVRSDRLQDHLDYLAGLLTDDRLDLIRRTLLDHGLEADASCFWFGPAGSPEPTVPASFQALMARLGGEIWVDFQRDDETEHAAERRIAAE